jgi:hypothetical protein
MIADTTGGTMIRKLKDGQYRIYSRSIDARTGKRRNLGTFPSRRAALEREREIQFFARHRG